MLLLLQNTGSRHVGFSSCGSWALERGLSSCVTQAQLRYGACSLLTREGTMGRFPSTALPGKSQEQLWFQWFCIFFFFILHGFPYLYCFIHSTLGLLSFSRFLRQKLRSFILVSFLFFPIQFSLVAQSCPTLCDPMDCSTPASLSVTSSWSLLRLMFIESMMPSNHLILYCPLLLPPSVFPSIRVFSNEVVPRIRWPKYCSYSFSISLSNEYSRLISFRMDRLDPLAVQGTLKSLFPIIRI